MDPLPPAKYQGRNRDWFPHDCESDGDRRPYMRLLDHRAEDQSLDSNGSNLADE